MNIRQKVTRGLRREYGLPSSIPAPRVLRPRGAAAQATRAEGGGATTINGIRAAKGPRAGRLTLQECRELLGPGVEIEDEELEQVRDALYELAEVVVDAVSTRQGPPRRHGVRR